LKGGTYEEVIGEGALCRIRLGSQFSWVRKKKGIREGRDVPMEAKGNKRRRINTYI